ncbi:hypothetical protein GYMLUDRAFT_48435 [Collybiopsis luxurians FD-317 M1]|uniref:F-box domain-containing protein n=1 Tax=Collybiopsis luxurians FD-317 M1 TaxID=944289 RepID=A0A0D0CIB1_9AGAR|nr:hypothetical protein GYMLUDRAFT_48435 [Collybiopsis luxurians FD-317 M1]
MITSADKDIADYQAEVIRLRAQITYIEVQQELLEEHKMKLQSLLSPVRKIPNETLSRIFEYVCKENLFQDHPWPEDSDNKGKISPPTELSGPAITYLPTMAISSVCARWRELALSLPSLWSQLKLEIFTAFQQEESPVSLIATLEIYLERSGDWPLAIALNIRGDTTGDIPSALVHILPHTHRWKRFKYSGEHTLTDFHILSNFRFPLLSRLELEADSKGIPSRDLDRFEHAPKLRFLSTDQWFPCKIPYDQLRLLSIGTHSRADMEQVLRSCPLLISLELYSQSDLDFETVTPAKAATSWRNITLLQFNMAHGKLYEMVFSSFNFPSLNHLRMKGKQDLFWPGRAIDSFISRSSCRITILTMDKVSVSDVELIAALRMMTYLEKLEVQDGIGESPITSHLISSLHAVGRNRSTGSIIYLVPKLQSLRLYFNGEALDDRAFARMIVSRWLPDPELASGIGVDCLRQVVLKCCKRNIDAETYKPLRDLDKMGLRVAIMGRDGVQV